jgi:hypothetical protein
MVKALFSLRNPILGRMAADRITHDYSPSADFWSQSSGWVAGMEAGMARAIPPNAIGLNS